MATLDIHKSFDHVSNAFSGGIIDPYPIYTEMRRDHPVWKGDIQAKYGVQSLATDLNGVNPTYTLFKYNDIMHVLKEPKNFTNSIIADKFADFVGRILPAMDGEEHRTTRALLAPTFSSTAVQEWKVSLMGPLARDFYVVPLKSRGRCNLLADVAVPFPIHVIYRIIGFPDDQGAFEQFADLGMRILAASGATDPETFETAMNAARDFYDLVLPLVAERRAAGAVGGDVISALLRANVEGHTLDDDMITCFLRGLIPGAAETTTRTFATLMALLLAKPDLLDRLRADRSLIAKAIEESQRLEPVNAFMARQAMIDVTLSGVDIPAGAGLLLATGSANRDEDIYEHADEFDMARRDRTGLQFGFGIHVCLGQNTAKAEIEVLLNAILDEWPNLRLDPQYEPPVLQGMHFRGPDHLNVIWDA